MKKAFFFILIMSAATAASAQDYKYIYYLDKNFASVDEASALFVGKGYDDKGLFALDGFDRRSNAIFLKAHFADSTLSDLQGLFQTFFPNGDPESEGNYQHSLQEGVWTDWDNLGRKTDSIVFVQGAEKAHGRFSYYTNSVRRHSSFFDSTIKKGTDIFYAESGLKEKEIINEGDSIIALTYKDGTFTGRERVRSAGQKEAEFPGGFPAFRKFLEKNLNASTPSDHNAPAGTYNVIVTFTIDKDGTMSDIAAETGFGYGMEQEAVRVMKLSPPWTPAMLNNVPVKAYHRQPITFVISEDIPAVTGKGLPGKTQASSPARSGLQPPPSGRTNVHSGRP